MGILYTWEAMYNVLLCTDRGIITITCMSDNIYRNLMVRNWQSSVAGRITVHCLLFQSELHD